jgi:hypothetical protein
MKEDYNRSYCFTYIPRNVLQLKYNTLKVIEDILSRKRTKKKKIIRKIFILFFSLIFLPCPEKLKRW